MAKGCAQTERTIAPALIEVIAELYIFLDPVGIAKLQSANQIDYNSEILTLIML